MIQNNIALVKAGTGTQTLSGINTYTGGTTVNAGILNLGAGGGSGAIRGTLTINPGATVNTTVTDAIGYTSGSTIASPINIYGGTLTNSSGANEGIISTFNLMGGTMSSGGGFYNFSGSSSAINSLATNVMSVISGPLQLRADGLTISNAQGTVSSGIDLQISGTIFPITGNPYGIVKTGAGTLLLTGNNSYSNLTINAGTVQVGTASIYKNGNELGNKGTVTLTNGSSLALNSPSVSSTYNFPPSFVLGGGTISDADAIDRLATGAGATINVTAATTLQRQWGHVTSKYLALDGLLQGSAALTLQGYGGSSTEGSSIWISNPGNTYSGTATVNANTGSGGFALVVGTNNALQYATVNLSGTAPGSDTALTGNGGVQFASGVTAPIFSGLSGNGKITLQDLSGTPLPVVLTVSSSPTNFAGVLSGSGSLVKAGSGTLTLANANTYTGNTTISAGTLVLSGSGSIASSTNISVAGGATLDVSGLSSTFALGSGKTLNGSGGGTGTIVGRITRAARRP